MMLLRRVVVPLLPPFMPLPDFCALRLVYPPIRRFKMNYWFEEKNKTIVNFPVKSLDMRDFCEPHVVTSMKSTKYDLLGSSHVPSHGLSSLNARPRPCDPPARSAGFCCSQTRRPANKQQASDPPPPPNTNKPEEGLQYGSKAANQTRVP